MSTKTITADKVKQNDRIVYGRGPGMENPRSERVVRVTPGPRGYVHLRTDRCDRVVKVATEVEVEVPEATAAESKRMKTYTATFTLIEGWPERSRREVVKTRKSEADYVAACYFPRTDAVSFHRSEDAAYRKAGSRGMIVRVEVAS